jgi:O-antigen ligase
VPSLHRQWQELTDTSSSNAIPLDEDASLGKNWGGRSIRSAIWKCSEDILRTHWLTGVGTGDIQDSLQQAYENRKFYFASRYNHYNAHNEYLQMAIGHGVAGVLILILCIVVPAGMIKTGEVRTSQLSFLFLFAAICFTEVILDINKGIIWYSFFNSIFAFVRPENYLPTSKT